MSQVKCPDCGELYSEELQSQQKQKASQRKLSSSLAWQFFVLLQLLYIS